MAKKKGGLGRGLDALFADAAPINEDEVTENKEKAGSGEGSKKAVVDREEKASTKSASVSSSESGSAHSDSPKKAPANRTKANSTAYSKSDANNDANNDEDRVIYVDINDIKPGKAQPRKKFDENKIKELANSIRENGVIQPLVVKKAANGYELVAGERRWRASRIANLKKVPCLVRSFDEKQTMIVAIIENMQREDLDPIEEANGLSKIMNVYDFTQEQAAETLGKSRAYIANSLRLLKLPDKIKELVSDGTISAAHGRTIINIPDEKLQNEICDKVVKKGLSVRDTERLAEKAKDIARPNRPKRETKATDKNLKVAEEELRKTTGTKVVIKGSEVAGKIEIEYYSLDELNRLIELIVGADKNE